MVDFEAGERRTASLMLAHAFCMGLATVFFETAASALFLTHYPASAIPIVYIAAAIVSVVTGLLYSRLERKVAFWPLMAGTLIFLATTVLAFRIAISLTTAAIVVFALFVWYRLLSILTDVEYWAVATRLYDIRQAKRLFGFIGSGEVTARMAGAFAIPLLVRTIGTSNLIVVSAIALLACVVLILSVRRDDHSQPPSRALARGPKSQAWRDPYVRTIITVAALGVLGKHFVDFSFLQQMQIRYRDANQLASFFGIFSGVTQAINLLVRVTISGRFLQRFGIAAALQTLPAVHLVCTFALLVVAFVDPSSAPLFWLVIANQGIYKTLKHPIDNPSIKVLYQPLRRDTRLEVQVINEVIATPVAIGLAGIVMLLFTRVVAFDIRVFAVIMLLTFVLWIAAARLAWRRYVIALRDALQKRHVEADVLDEAGRARLRELTSSDDRSIADAALIELRGTPEAAALLSSPIEEISETTRQALIESPDRESAQSLIRERLIPSAVRRAIPLLEDHHLRSSAAATLVAVGDASIPAIEQRLKETTATAVIERLLRICGRIGGSRAVEVVRAYLHASDEGVREQALAALVNSGYRAGIEQRGEIETMIRADAEEGANESSLRDALPGGDAFALVRSALMTELERARERIMLALSLIIDSAAIGQARRHLQSASRERRAYAAELLDASVPPNLRRIVLPLFAHSTKPLHLEPAVVLRRIIEGRTFTSWTKTCASHALEPTMQTTIEKVITLKSVDLFTRTPDDVLAQLAAELEAIDVAGGETIIRQGEMGDSLYIIAAGSVRVHDGETTIATLGEREIFGELAVLDPEPRSASVTAISAVTLYRLDRDDLFELLPDHIEIVRGIFHVLCSRLRHRT